MSAGSIGRYGTSQRSTVREAIRQLAGRKVLATRQGSGVFVTALDAPEDWDAVLRRADIVAAIEARTAIETEAAALAATRRTTADLRAMRRALDGRRSHAPGVEAHVDADTAFHRSVVVAAHNPILLELFDGFTPRLRQAMVEMLRLRSDDGGQADDDRHALLVDAVASRDSARVAAESRSHLADLARTLG